MPARPVRPLRDASSNAGRPSTRAKPVLRFRTRITIGERVAVGPGKIDLLEAVEDTGSITAAAKTLQMSYRRAWLLLDELNGALQRPAVDSAKGGEHGGGTTVTEAGRRLIALYRRIEATAAAAGSSDIRQLMKMLAR